jgi:DNA-binding CsgD family transcriptional regulator
VDTPLTTLSDDQGHLRSALRDWKRRSGLTPREFDLVVELCAGHANKLIARRLGLSASTVASELKILFRRIGVTSRAELVAQCFRHVLSDWKRE